GPPDRTCSIGRLCGVHLKIHSAAQPACLEVFRLKRRRTTMAAAVPKDFRRVIVAAAVGNVIEWYDFYIFGSLAAIWAVKFFDKTHPDAALLNTIALFTAGFLIRPLGAFLFECLGGR